MSAIQQIMAATKPAIALPTTWNPSDKQAIITLSGGNMIATSTGGAGGVRGTNAKASGKYYFEVRVSTGVNMMVGVASIDWNTSNQLASTAESACYYNMYITSNGYSTFVEVPQMNTLDIIGVAVDIDARVIYWSCNGVWLNSASPSSGIGWISYVTTKPVFPAFYAAGGANTGSATLAVSTMSYSPPSGFTAWN